MNYNPRYPIPQLGFPIESYCELFGAFGNGMVKDSPDAEPVYKVEHDEVKKILELGDLLTFDAGRVGSNIMVKETRDSTIAWIDDNPQAQALEMRQWLINRMQNIVAKVNRDKFQMDLDFFHPLQYTTYALNQHYDWHVDTHEGMESDAQRKLSCVVMLTDPDEYEGGELELNLGGNAEDGKTKLLKPPKGTAVFFYSHVPHRVRPVTKGKRVSLVLWAMGPKPR